MLFTRFFSLAQNYNIKASNPLRYYFAVHKQRKSKYTNKTDDFQNMQKEQTKQYFQQYRKEVEKDTVIRDFRKQIFQKNNESAQMKQFDHVLDEQQKQLDKLLSQGKKAQINRYSKKIMQHMINNRGIFKGKSTQNVFKDYANYSAYKTNNVSIEDRNYGNMDMLDRSNQERNSYEFIDKLPENYDEKQEVRTQIQQDFPAQSAMTISQYGRRIQQKHQDADRYNEFKSELSHQNYFKVQNIDDEKDQLEDQTYQTAEQSIDPETLEPLQMGMLSSGAMSKIYDLYLQGWSVRQISRRFGILPARTKFYIWARARLYDQILPKYGAKYLFYILREEQDAMQTNSVIDYGLDLQDMQKTDRYQEIVTWTNKRVDAQRTPDQYTQALQKLEARKKFDTYDMIQVGTHGKENKKHLLKEWKIHRGKKSEQYFLKNKIFKHLMFQNRKTKNVYY